MFVKIKGLITRETRYKDHDKILTIVTAERGRMTVRARGVMRLKSPFAPACQLFAYTEFTLFENKGLFSVNAAEPLELFLGLRADARKLALAAYFADLAEKIAESDTACDDLLRLTLNCFYALASGLHPPELIRAAFEMRAAVIAGYEPQLDVCIRCGSEPTNPYILPEEGGVCCADCLTPSDRSGCLIRCPAGVLPLLSYFASAPLKRLLPAVSDSNLIDSAVFVTERYLFSQLGCDPKPLRFYQSLTPDPAESFRKESTYDH